MYKMVCVLYRKPGMTHEEFRRHYDTSHAPLVKSLMGDNLLRYVRNYSSGMSGPSPVGEAPTFDCITEFHFADKAAFDRAFAVVEHPDNAPKVRADEKRFLDIDRVQVAIVEEFDHTDGTHPG